MARNCPLVLHENLTRTQVDILRSKTPYLLITGPAGTAKTYTAVARGLRLLFRGDVEKITIFRSAVPTRNIGFLPGDPDEKIDAYATPYIDLIDQLSPKMRFREMVAKKLIEFESTSFLRGRTYDQTYMLIDEYQNMNGHELETTVTRVGKDTHLVVCGDSDQVGDLRGAEAHEHHDVILTLTRMDEFAVFRFGVDDIVRSGFVRSFYEAKAAIQKLPPHVTGSPV